MDVILLKAYGIVCLLLIFSIVGIKVLCQKVQDKTSQNDIEKYTVSSQDVLETDEEETTWFPILLPDMNDLYLNCEQNGQQLMCNDSGVQNGDIDNHKRFQCQCDDLCLQYGDCCKYNGKVESNSSKKDKHYQQYWGCQRLFDGVGFVTYIKVFCVYVCTYIYLYFA